VKKNIHDLAIMGGSPLFHEALHVGRPNIGDRRRLIRYFEEILDRKWFTNNGPLVQELEQKIASYLEVEHCILTCNATVALEIAIRALNLHGEAIVPSFTFVATAHVFEWLGIKPIFCDIDPETHNIDPREIPRLIQPGTSAILGVHVWGRPCPIDELAEIASKYHLSLFFDAAHAFGSTYKGQRIGRFGNLEVFSFHATKFFNTFEGGAITTQDAQLATKIRRMVNFGFAGYDNVVSLGINGKMTEISAAMGLASFTSLDSFIEQNYSNYCNFAKHLQGIPGVKIIEFDPKEKNNYQYVVFELDPLQAGISRDGLVKILHAENVLARKYFYPGIHCMEPYRSIYPDLASGLKNTEELVTRTVCLPNGQDISQADVIEICELIRFVIENHQLLS
jgi:dTDP-4-amino-4,6-dideoxygalactose transaminase